MVPTKEVFQYPTPADLTAKDLAPNKPATKKNAEKKKAKDKTEAKKKVGAQASRGQDAAG